MDARRRNGRGKAPHQRLMAPYFRHQGGISREKVAHSGDFGRFQPDFRRRRYLPEFAGGRICGHFRRLCAPWRIQTHGNHQLSGWHGQTLAPANLYLEGKCQNLNISWSRSFIAGLLSVWSRNTSHGDGSRLAG